MSTTTDTEEVTTMVADLAKAKDAVLYCLNHADGLVDMHGLKYWAGRVEDLRKDLRRAL